MGQKLEGVIFEMLNIKEFNGKPTVFVDSKPINFLLGFVSSQYLSNFREAGYKLIQPVCSMGWVGPEEYDFKRTDRQIEAYLKVDPDVLLCPRFMTYPGGWWHKAFPDEIPRLPDGRPSLFNNRGLPRQSFASQVYQILVCKAITAFVCHMEEKYDSHIFGYFPSNGIFGEWASWNSFWDEGRLGNTYFGVEDYSKPMQKAFRKYLRNKYHNSTETLRKSWGNQALTFEMAQVPSEDMRKQPTHGLFFDPATSSQVYDYFDCFNDIVASVAIDQCKTIKQIVGNDKLVGLFFGYLWTNYSHHSQNHTGHLSLRKLLESPYVDFIADPFMYDNRDVGGTISSQTLPSSIALHGKLHVTEIDNRNYHSANSSDLFSHYPKDLKETVSIMLRNYGYNICNSSGMWFMDLLDGEYNYPDMIQALARIREIDQRYTDFDKQSNNEIAVLLDADGFKYFRDGEVLVPALLSIQKQFELAYIGAGYDDYLLEDLANPKMRDYKLYIFLNNFDGTDDRIRMIHNKLKKNNATAIWIYAPGYVNKGLSTANIKALTGFRLREEMTPGELTIEITNSATPYTNNLPVGHTYGTDQNLGEIKSLVMRQSYLKDPDDPKLERDLPGFCIAPRFYGDDSEGIILGQLIQFRKPGLLMKKMDGWISIYSAAPIISKEVLRNIAKASGCHIYSNANDVIYANNSFLTVYATEKNTRTIHLPKSRKVTDVWKNQVLSKKTTEFELELEPFDTKLFCLE